MGIRRTLIDSFLEGFIAPWLEFYLALVISSMITALLTLEEIFGQLLSSLGKQPISAPNVLQLIAITLAIMAILDLFRNLAIGYLLPAHAIAHVSGEILSLVIFFRLILVSAPTLIHYTILETISSVYLSIIVMFLGVLIRVCIELYMENEIWCR